MQKAEIERYRALEEERHKWEERERRAVEQLDAVKAELDKRPVGVGRGGVGGVCGDSAALSEQLAAAESQLETAEMELRGSRALLAELQTERSATQLELEEVKAELNLMRAKVRRLERPTAEGTMTTDSGPPPSLTCRVPMTGSPLPSPRPSHALAPSTTLPAASTLAPSTTLPAASTLVPSTTLPAASTLAPSTILPAASTLIPSTTLPAASTRVPSTTLPVVSTLAPLATLPAASMLAPLPQLSRFSGDEFGDEETIDDWIEQFGSVARLAMWDEHYKLVHLMNRLKGPALSLFRSCSPTRSDYTLLVAEFRKWFMPVHLSSVQSQLFHDRHQGAKESADEYAQELRKLF